MPKLYLSKLRVSAKGDGFDRLEERLSLSQQTASVESSNVQNPPKDQLQVLINLYTKVNTKRP